MFQQQIKEEARLVARKREESNLRQEGSAKIWVFKSMCPRSSPQLDATWRISLQSHSDPMLKARCTEAFHRKSPTLALEGRCRSNVAEENRSRSRQLQALRGANLTYRQRQPSKPRERETRRLARRRTQPVARQHSPAPENRVAKCRQSRAKRAMSRRARCANLRLLTRRRIAHANHSARKTPFGPCTRT